jgi:hypothetical protein
MRDDRFDLLVDSDDKVSEKMQHDRVETDAHRVVRAHRDEEGEVFEWDMDPEDPEESWDEG